VANLFALASVQISNAGLPLLVFPYVLKMVGEGLYTRIAISEAVAIIVGTFVLFSFDIEGVGKVAGLDMDEDGAHISQVFSEIFVTRSIIFLSCMIMLLVVSPLLPSNSLTSVLPWMLIPLSYVFQPTWLYIGLERNSPLAVCTIISRLLAIVLVVLLVKSPADYLWMPMVIGALYLSGGIASYCYALWEFGIKLSYVPFGRVKELLFAGKEIFFGLASVILYRDLNVILINVVGGSGIDIAAYSISEKIVKGVQAAIRPLNQLYFPRALVITRNASLANRQVFKEIFKLTIPQLSLLGIFVLVAGISLALFWTHIPTLLIIPNISKIGVFVSVMIWSVFFGVTNFMLGTGGLNHLNERVYYFKSILLAGISNVMVCAVMAALFGGIGAAISFVVAEAFLTALVVRKYIH